MKKITIYGAGFVGATLANSLVHEDFINEIVLKDLTTDLAKGKALDINQSGGVIGSSTTVKVAEKTEEIGDSDIVVITAGSPRKPGMTRDDLLFINGKTMNTIANEIKEYAPNAIVIVVTNPLDVMTYTILKATGFPKNRVIGMAGILDSSRMKSFVYEKLGFGSSQIQTMVLGSHGDTMVPLLNHSNVAGIPLRDFLSEKEEEEIVERTKNGGAEVVSYLKTGSAYYAPAQSVTLMCQAIINDQKTIYTCATYLEGEYGYQDTVVGVPIILGAKGVERILEIDLNKDEKEQLDKSVSNINSMITTVKNQIFQGSAK